MSNQQLSTKTGQLHYTLWLLLGYAHREAENEAAARHSWELGMEAMHARRDVSSENPRVRAWLAAIEAAAGHRDKALTDIAWVYGAHPKNAYLLYRLAHVYAELEMFEDAIQTLTSANNNGFISVQLMRREEALSLKKLIHMDGYQNLARKMERQVNDLRSNYSL